MEKDLVSIILPVYNAQDTIKKSIDSVLKQTYGEYELIVINDGSTDSSEDIIKTYADERLFYIKNESNLGLIKTLNKGLLASKGEFIARIDADDEWIHDEKISKQVHFLNMVPECVLIGTQASFSNGKITSYPLTDAEIRNSILIKNPFIHSSVMFRKSSVLDETYQKEDYLIEDYSLWLRLGKKGMMANLEECAVNYFINPNGETRRNNFIQTKNSFNLIRRHKGEYPNYHIALSIWGLKVTIRKILSLLNLK